MDRGQQTGSLVLIQSTRVDLDALRRLGHRCEPLKCRHARKCCNSYEVVVNRRQQSGVVGTMPQAARYAKGLRDGAGYVDPFGETDGGTCLVTHEDGLCVFAYGNRQGATLCSLHSAAQGLGLAPERVKPLACALWPLFLVESEPSILTVQEDAYSFPCNYRRKRGASGLQREVAEIIRTLFGASFLEELYAVL